jgi:hypothetical protein
MHSEDIVTFFVAGVRAIVRAHVIIEGFQRY